jgi:hypothetical protein
MNVPLMDGRRAGSGCHRYILVSGVQSNQQWKMTNKENRYVRNQ